MNEFVLDGDQMVQLSELDERSLQAVGLPPISYHRLWRAGRYGTVARDGRRIRLKLDRLGGKLYTTLNQIRSYIKCLNEADAQYFLISERPKGPSSKRVRPRPSSPSTRLEKALRTAAEEGL